MKTLKIFAKNILIPVLTGAIVGLIIQNKIDYQLLNKPFLSPPKILFPIIWTIIYILMGISYAILENKNQLTSKISKTYFISLIVNALWSIIFFLLKWRFFSIIWIFLLDYLVIKLTILINKENKISALIQIPYIIWLLFATYLTIGIFILN